MIKGMFFEEPEYFYLTTEELNKEIDDYLSHLSTQSPLYIPPKYEVRKPMIYVDLYSGSCKLSNESSEKQIEISEKRRFLDFLEKNKFKLPNGEYLNLSTEFSYIAEHIFDDSIVSPSRRQCGLTTALVFYAIYQNIVNNSVVLISNKIFGENDYVRNYIIDVLRENPILKTFIRETDIQRTNKTVFIEIDGRLKNVSDIIIEYSNKKLVPCVSIFIDDILRNDDSFRGLISTRDLLKARLKNFVVYDYVNTGL